MASDPLINELAGIVRSGAPLVLAAIGETFTERAGVVNLSLDGSLMLSALAGFVVALNTESLILGTLTAMIVGMVVALIVAFSSIELKQSQVAVGFILTLLCRDLAIFLGTPYRSKPGVPVPYLSIPGLQDLPVLGPILFQQDVFTYLSYLAIIVAWFWIFRTKAGLALRSVGERPQTAFARGLNVNRLRYFYTALGGSLVGLAGAAFTLSIISTWTESGIVGNGWIALAIVIFGGWYPLRIALGVYLVAGLRTVVLALQSSTERQILDFLNVLPWLLIIGTAVVILGPYLDLALRAAFRRLPQALGVLKAPLKIAVYAAALAVAVVLGRGSGNTRQVIELLNALPWLLMLGTLLVVSGPYLNRLLRMLPSGLHPLVRTLLRAKPPAALGTTFEQEGRR